MARDRTDAHFLPHRLARHASFLFRHRCILLSPRRKFEIRRMVFEISSSADITVWTDGLGAWFAAVRFARGINCWLAEGLNPSFSLGLISSLTGGLHSARASNPIPWSASGPVARFGSKLVKQIGRELLARPFCRQQLLCACRSPREAPAGPLSLPVPSVPSSCRLRMGRYLT